MFKNLSPRFLALIGAAVVMMMVDLYLVFGYVSIERRMGIVQKIFYFHVPSAAMAFVAFFVVFIASIMLLLRGNHFWDSMAASAAEIGLLFTSIVLLTGPLWAKPVWNTYWTWDPRLTTTLILWFIYAGYLMIRSFTEDREKRARFSAVFGIIGFIDVPIVYMSTRWWRTIHPSPVIMGGSDSGLAPDMSQTLMFSMLTFMLLLAVLLILRVRLELSRQSVQGLRREILSR